MSDEIKLNYDMAEEMARTFAQGAEQLQDTMQELQSIANTLEGGGLRGRGGQAYVEAIRNKLSPALARLTDKFRELEEDVKVAIEAMREADDTSEQKFS
jgi:WXG100 family type VII secretion target